MSCALAHNATGGYYVLGEFLKMLPTETRCGTDQ